MVYLGVSAAEKFLQQSKHLCFYCGSPNHFVSLCSVRPHPKPAPISSAVSSGQHLTPKSISNPIVHSGSTIAASSMLPPCIASIKLSTTSPLPTPAPSPAPLPPLQSYNPALDDYIAQFKVAVSQHNSSASAPHHVSAVSFSGVVPTSPSSTVYTFSYTIN